MWCFVFFRQWRTSWGIWSCNNNKRMMNKRWQLTGRWQVVGSPVSVHTVGVLPYANRFLELSRHSCFFYIWLSNMNGIVCNLCFRSRYSRRKIENCTLQVKRTIQMLNVFKCPKLPFRTVFGHQQLDLRNLSAVLLCLFSVLSSLVSSLMSWF